MSPTFALPPLAETRCQHLLHRMSGVVFELAPEGTLRYANAALATLTGYPLETIIGQNWWEVFFRGDQCAPARALHAQLQTGDVSHYAVTLTARTGECLTWELDTANVYDAQGELAAIVGFGIDRTRRRQAEATLRTLNAELETRVADRTQALEAANAALREEAERRTAAEEELIATLEEVRQQNDELVRSRAELESLARYPEENPNPVLRLDAAGALRYANYASQPLLAAWDCERGELAPLFLRQVLDQARASGQHQSIDIACGPRIHELHLVWVLGADYANVYGRDITERKRAEAQIQNANTALEAQSARLQQAQVLLEAVTEATGVIIAAVDTEYRYTFFNKAYQAEVERLSGKTIQIGTSMLETFAHMPEQQHIVAAEWRPALAGEGTNKRVTFGDPQVYQRVYGVLHTPLREAGGAVVGAGEVAYDLTPQVEAEQALRLSEQRFRLALKNAPVTVATQDRNLRFTWAYNQRTVGPETVIGKTDTDLFPPDTAAALRTFKRQVLETGLELGLELWVVSGGRQLFLKVFLEPIRDEAGAIIGVGVATVDLTEQKLAEEALQAAQAELEKRVIDRTQALQQANAQLRLQTSALLAAANGVVITDRGGRMLWSNPAFTTLTGYTAAEVLGQTPRLVRSGQHPPAFYAQMWQTILAGEVWQGEMVNRRKDGTLYIEEQTITPLRDETGQVSHFIAIKQDVSMRRQMEQALRRANDLLERVFDSIDLLVAYLDRDFNLLRLNRAYAQAEQRPPEACLGQNFFTLHPVPELQALFGQVAVTGEAYTAYERAFVFDGPASRYWDWSLQPVKDAAGQVQGLVLSLVDVSQRKQAEDRLRQNALQSQAVAEISQALLQAKFDAPAVIQAITRGAAALFNDLCLTALVSEDRQWLTIKSFHHPDPDTEQKLRPYFQGLPSRLPAGRIAGHVIDANQPLRIASLFDPAGRAWFAPADQVLAGRFDAHSLMAIPLHAPGQTLGQLLLLRLRPGAPYTLEEQQTAQNLADHAVLALINARLYQDLEAALALEQATRAQLVQTEKLVAMGRVVASVAHELNNPLQTIKNCLYLTNADLPAASPIHEYLDMASSEVQRLTNLVAQLRTLYRPRQTQPAERVNLLSLLEDVHRLVAPHLEEQRVEWQLTSGVTQAWVSGVADQLKQVFINLCQNAGEAMQTTGGLLTLEVNLAADGQRLGVTVRDMGPGIAPEHIDRLFEPFFTTKPTGLGLGLAICNDIVQRHGGTLAVDSQVGFGAAFTVWLPADPASAPG